MGITPNAIAVLSSHEWLGRLFDDVVARGMETRGAPSFLVTEVLHDSRSGDASLSSSLSLSSLSSPIASWQLVEILKLVNQGTITTRQAKDLYSAVRNTAKSPSDVVNERGIGRLSNELHIKLVSEQVVHANPSQVKAYREGRSGLLGFFMGQVMKGTNGSADPRVAGTVLRGLLMEDESDVER